ncbi:hypothetical protein MLD38_022526 [Melastoma candidum]|uniref:Uncharacterized protein n=1 Tax=Melastoma candidum TaxID=119954 RepID=A0ACB9QNG3_9MYRT|nr:hypothetical protein MLD38_022526 [Melastoma candidum]
MEVSLTQEAEQPSGTPTAADDVIAPRNHPPANGFLKRHGLPRNHHRLGVGAKDGADLDVAYKECLKNHAASLGGHALDGCREFMPSPAATPFYPKSLKCDACGCHRNFHRRCFLDDSPLPVLPPPPQPASSNPGRLVNFQPLNRHQQSPPPPPVAVVPLAAAAPIRSPGSSSPPPISSAYYSPMMRLPAGPDSGSGRRTGQQKRFRTKFSPVQKEKMLEFAEKVGWRMQRSNLTTIRDFCEGIGVDRNVFKVWMHNNKNTLGKRMGTVSPNGLVGETFTNEGENGIGCDDAIGSGETGGARFVGSGSSPST